MPPPLSLFFLLLNLKLRFLYCPKFPLFIYLFIHFLLPRHFPSSLKLITFFYHISLSHPQFFFPYLDLNLFPVPISNSSQAYIFYARSVKLPPLSRFSCRSPILALNTLAAFFPPLHHPFFPLLARFSASALFLSSVPLSQYPSSLILHLPVSARLPEEATQCHEFSSPLPVANSPLDTSSSVFFFLPFSLYSFLFLFIHFFIFLLFLNRCRSVFLLLPVPYWYLFFFHSLHLPLFTDFFSSMFLNRRGSFYFFHTCFLFLFIFLLQAFVFTLLPFFFHPYSLSFFPLYPVICTCY